MQSISKMDLNMHNFEAPTENPHKKRKSKLGRKGDPRMHAAVNARLDNPKLGLREALEQGGFVFTTEANGSIFDSEKVALSQRKNQLSRRLRMLKQQSKTDSEGFAHGSDPSSQGNFNGMTVNGKKLPATGTCRKAKKRRTPGTGMPCLLQRAKDSRLEAALSQFRGDMSSLLKSSMIKAGYENSQTDECDEAYLNFAEKALEGEMSRISRIRKKLYPNSSASLLPTDQKMSLLGIAHSSIAHSSAAHSSAAHSSSVAHSHDHSHAHDSHSNVHSHSHENGDSKPEYRECMHSRHMHRLSGKCGHKAILHKPANGAPHIDFLVDGKVECYEGRNPVADANDPEVAAFWPSTLKREDPLDNQNLNGNGAARKQAICDDENCVGSCYDPKIFERTALDFASGEWTEFDPDEALENLISLCNNTTGV